MAFDGTDSCWIPEVPIGKSNERRLRQAQYGDGYAQRTLDGINALNVRFTVSFPLRKVSVITEMETYLKDQRGNAFLFWDVATGTMHNVWCDKWQIDWIVRRRNIVGGVSQPKYYGTLTADFVKAYGATT